MVPTSLNSLPWSSLVSSECFPNLDILQGFCVLAVFGTMDWPPAPGMSVQFLTNLFQISSVSLRKLGKILFIMLIYIDGITDTYSYLGI